MAGLKVIEPIDSVITERAIPCSPKPGIQLYRFFEELTYCDQFLAGKARFGLQKSYVVTDNPRADGTEATARYISPSGKERKAIGCNENYIMCFSHVRCQEQFEALQQRFGKKGKQAAYAVRIRDLFAYTRHIQDVLLQSEIKESILGLRWYLVEYTKDKDQPKSDWAAQDLHVYQKPSKYQIESEWRLALCMKYSENPNFEPSITLESDFSRILSVEPADSYHSF